jgi:parallel beta-helix repeat protein
MLAALLAVLVLLSELSAPASPVEAQTQTGNLWTVTPGSAAQIQPAIDAARNAGGGRVRLPAAVYLLTEKVRLHNNVALYGDGMDRTILRWAPGATLDHMMSNGALTDGNQNFQVWDLTLDGQSIPSGRTDCCFGFRLNNVQDIFIVNVAADNHSKDGFYIGYNRDNGAHRVRLSGCRANGNARNGISLIHGTNNVIDHCQVNNNNRGEAVAGIDLEPDEGQSLTDNKVVANSANGQNVGIQLFVPFNGYATSRNNAVCQNSATGNVSAGIYDFRSDRNIFVDNQTSGNGTNFLVDDSALIGSQYASSCQLGQLPPHPSTVIGPTPTPTPPPSCSPRPPVTVTTQATAGTLRVTVAATRPAAVPNNTIRQIQFATAQNATIEISGQNRPGGFSVTLPAGTQQTTFTVRRLAGGQATTVPFSVVDDCGAWPTFVGGGPSAF